MTTENETIENPAVNTQGSDDDLEAGFKAVRGGQPAPQVTADPAPAAPATDQEPTAEPAAEPEVVQPAATETPPAAKPEPTEADLRELVQSLSTQVRNLAGNFGGLKSEVKREMSSLIATVKSQPKGSAAAADAKQAAQFLLKRVRDNWPDFADDLAADLEESLGAAGKAAPFDDAEFDRRVNAATDKVRSELATETLSMIMPDWQDRIAMRDDSGNVIVGADGKKLPSAKFSEFLASKGEEFSETFWKTNRPSFIVSAINEFEKANGPKPVADRQDKQARLRAAVVPEGRTAPVRQPVIDEEAAMEAGFANVRGPRR